MTQIRHQKGKLDPHVIRLRNNIIQEVTASRCCEIELVVLYIFKYQHLLDLINLNYTVYFSLIIVLEGIEIRGEDYLVEEKIDLEWW